MGGVCIAKINESRLIIRGKREWMGVEQGCIGIAYMAIAIERWGEDYSNRAVGPRGPGSIS